MTQKEMEARIEKLLEMPYRIIDILPGQVPADSPGHYFAIEEYFLDKQLAEIKQKHINVILKLNCYREIFIDGEPEGNPPPERIVEEMRSRYLSILVDDAMIVSEPDETYMTLYHPDEKLLNLVKAIAAGEGLFVWQPPV